MGGGGCEVTFGLAKVELRMRGVQILIRAIPSSTHLKRTPMHRCFITF